jgi:F420-non-reducing hydrogenase large subunit
MMSKRRYTIDPITRLEGHGKIDILLNEKGDVDHAYLQIPELRGFERFVQGRPAEDMPQITSRICGVCPTAHHMAATKALDDLYQVTPPAAARKVRELVYSIFMIEDHALHFYYLAGPDFVVGPTAPKAERNILGVLGVVGLEIGKEVIGMRKQLRDLMTLIMGKAIHPVFGLPGGISKAIAPEHQKDIAAAADHAVEFGKFSLKLFEDLLKKKPELLEYVTSESYVHRTYYMGMVDGQNRLNFYDGSLRVVDPGGKQVALFPGREYLNHIAEHVEPWSYVKFSYLKSIGWKGFVDGPESGVMAVAPLARLNAADGLATPIAQQAYEQYLQALGGKPVHCTLATSWARVVELIYAAERMRELANDPEIVSPNVRTIPTATPVEGIGVIEAPRGTLIHHYQTDKKGLITMANLIVATQNNSARIALSVDKAAKGAIKGGHVDDGILNLIEMAFRAYDPCHGCATHALPGQMPLRVRVFDAQHSLMREITRG